jgi:two-component system, LytTR family, response regulator
LSWTSAYGENRPPIPQARPRIDFLLLSAHSACTSLLLRLMRALIVDDEQIARKVLREELELLNTVEVVSEAENGEAALGAIRSLKPDLVFLDIQMPGMDGFDVLRRLKGGHLPVFVIVTAYDEHAIRAFEAGAVDYLLKPISQQRLMQALERARDVAGNRLRAAESVAHLQELLPAGTAVTPKARKIIGRRDEEFFLLSPEEVLAFQADGDTIWIITSEQRYTATQNLKSLEQRLQDTAFRRIHRNALVNVDQIRKLSMITSQRWLITLNNGDELVVSKRQARHVRDVLRW